MDPVNQEALFESAKQFREAILKLRQGLGVASLTDFPRGACGEASNLLGSYLKDMGYGSFDYMLPN